MDVRHSGPAPADQSEALLALYNRALPQVYGYLASRCRNEALAEDLTAETFLAAVAAVQKGAVDRLTTAWLVGVARHKLVDHWRRVAREERKLRAVEDEAGLPEDPWDEAIEASRAREALTELAAHHQAALTLRYLDGLSVPDVAEHLGRTIHATEALLVRARTAFRIVYGERKADG